MTAQPLGTTPATPDPTDAAAAGAALPPASLPRWRPFAELPRAHGGPVIRCRLRAEPADFVVDEVLAFGADGEGEHCLLRVRKTSANTDWTAHQLARLAGVPAKAVGYAGLKDRHAVTTQWFSVHLGPRPAPDWTPLAEYGIEVLECHRHRRKLRRGVLAGNAFVLRLREVQGDVQALAERVDRIAREGVPNYFGPQRFGRDQGNLLRADALFRDGVAHGIAAARRRSGASRHLQGLWTSAARAQLFNEVLARRVAEDTWHRALPGERLQLQGSHSHFVADMIDETLHARVQSGDVLPTGPLFGEGAALTGAAVREMETAVAAAFPAWIAGLGASGLKQERRPLGLVPEGLTLERPAADLAVLRFTLPAGSYATALLRELADWVE